MYFRPLAESPHDPEHRPGRQLMVASRADAPGEREEEWPASAAAAVPQVAAYCICDQLRQGDGFFLAASLPFDPDRTAGEVQLLKVQRAELRDPQPDTDEHDHDRVVPGLGSVSPAVSVSILRTSVIVGPRTSRLRSAFTPGASRNHVISPSIRASFDTDRSAAMCRLMVDAAMFADSIQCRNRRMISWAEGEDSLNRRLSASITLNGGDTPGRRRDGRYRMSPPIVRPT